MFNKCNVKNIDSIRFMSANYDKSFAIYDTAKNRARKYSSSIAMKNERSIDQESFIIRLNIVLEMRVKTMFGKIASSMDHPCTIVCKTISFLIHKLQLLIGYYNFLIFF